MRISWSKSDTGAKFSSGRVLFSINAIVGY